MRLVREVVSGRTKDPRVRKEKFLPLHVEGRSGGDGEFIVLGKSLFVSCYLL